MDKVFIGTIVSFHGIKGELRLLSQFSYKDKCFVVGKKVLIDDKEYTIKSYRHHKIYDMITLDGFTDLDQVLFLRNKKVYMSRQELGLADNDLLLEDLLHFKVNTTDNEEGKVMEVFDAGGGNQCLRIQLKSRQVLIPLNSPLIKELSIPKQLIIIELWKEM